MKSIYIITVLLIFSNLNTVAAQLYGSGKIETFYFDYLDFDKISIQDFDGKIEIIVGEDFSIQVDIDDNLAPRLRVELEDGILKMNLFENKNGRLYLESTNIKIKISLPKLVEFLHRGNTNVNILDISENTFKLNQSGNGNVVITGKADMLGIEKIGNGDVDAKKLIALSAKIKSEGNGNVFINSKIDMIGNGSGNGSIIQFGEGKIDILSGVIGNGCVRKSN